jgi:hypothetical protein
MKRIAKRIRLDCFGQVAPNKLAQRIETQVLVLQCPAHGKSHDFRSPFQSFKIMTP